MFSASLWAGKKKDSVYPIEGPVRPAAAQADGRQDIMGAQGVKVFWQANDVDRALAQVASDDLVGRAQVLVDHGPIIYYKHVRPLAFDELGVPQRR
jgi:hypothetical protein